MSNLNKQPKAIPWLTIISFLFAFIFIIPVLWALFVSIGREGQPITSVWDWFLPEYTLDNYRKILASSSIPRWLWNSTFITLVSVVVVVITSSLAAYAMTKIKFRGRNLLYLYFLIGLMVPGEATIVPLFITVNAMGLVNTYAGIILPGLASSFNLIVMITFFKGIPDALMEAARIDGASDFRIYYSLILPLSKPVMVTITIFTFIASWNNYLWPLLSAMGEDMFTLTVGLPTFVSTYTVDYCMPMAANMFAAIPAIILYLFCEKYIVEGIALSGIKG